MKRTLEEIHRAKAARRKALAALPYEEKIRIMEDLQKMGSGPHRRARAASSIIEAITDFALIPATLL